MHGASIVAYVRSDDLYHCVAPLVYVPNCLVGPSGSHLAQRSVQERGWYELDLHVRYNNIGLAEEYRWRDCRSLRVLRNLQSRSNLWLGPDLDYRPTVVRDEGC